jgi:hypothetical protein
MNIGRERYSRFLFLFAIDNHLHYNNNVKDKGYQLRGDASWEKQDLSSC